MIIVRYRGVVPKKFRGSDAALPSYLLMMRLMETSRDLWVALLALRGEKDLKESDLVFAMGSGTVHALRFRMWELGKWGLAYKIGDDYVVSHTPITLRKATAILNKSRGSVCGV